MLGGTTKAIPWTAAVLVIVLLVLAALWKRSPAPVRAVEVRGADISFTLQEEAAGTTFSDQGTTLPVERILAAHGADYVRLRVWVDPPPGYSDEASVLALAKRASVAGLKIILAPHYSDFWADPYSQEIPAAWRGADLSTMETIVGEYTRDLVAKFDRQGTPVDMVQIGNEVTNGMLWPLGLVDKGQSKDWADFAALVNSAITGAREGAPGHRISVLIHADSGGDIGRSRHFFDKLIEAGVTSFDIIGLTYYPFWNGSLADLRANLNDLALRYRRDLLVVETSYPWTLETGNPNAWVTAAEQLPDGTGLPPTPAGQERYFAELRRIIREIPNHHGLGFVVWEPGWLTVGAKPGERITGANLAMFDRHGRALPSLSAAFSPDASDAD